MSSLDRARVAMDVVATTVDALGLLENGIFGEDLVDTRVPARRVVFSEDVFEIADRSDQ
jgi:hypothetical protein